MVVRKLVLVSILGLAVTLWAGCESPPGGVGDGASGSAHGSSPGAGGGGETVVATVNGTPITAAEIEQVAGNQLKQVEHKRYMVMKKTVDTVIEEKLVQQEAERRGITPEELYKAEVLDKIEKPTEDQLRQYFELNRARAEAMGKTFEDVRGEIEQGLVGQDTVQLTHEFVDGLKDQADIRLELEAPRFEIEVTDSDLKKGPADAPITVVEYADYECGYCKQSAPTIERLLAEYGDRIQFVYRDFPLGSHRRAFPSARAARCAGEQDKFWEYHSELMTGFGDLSDPDLVKRAEKLGLDVAAFRECYASRRHGPAVNAAAESGRDLGVGGTPAFFINGRFVNGAMGYEGWQRLIEEELAAVGG